MLQGDIASGRLALRGYSSATIGFDTLAEATNTPAESLMRIFRPKGNSTAENLFAVICARPSRGGENSSAENSAPVLRLMRGN